MDGSELFNFYHGFDEGDEGEGEDKVAADIGNQSSDGLVGKEKDEWVVNGRGQTSRKQAEEGGGPYFLSEYACEDIDGDSDELALGYSKISQVCEKNSCVILFPVG